MTDAVELPAAAGRVPARGAAAQLPSTAAPAPRALIDYDFQSVLTAPPRQRIVLWLMAGAIAALAVTLTLAKVDILISANGRVVTSDSEIVVQPLETSVVRSVAVKMGQQVAAGEVLATLDPTFTAADEEEIEAKLRFLQASFNRIEAEMAGEVYDPANPNPDEATQRDAYRKRRDEYTARYAAAERKISSLRADLAAHRIEVSGLREQIRLATEAQSIYQQLVAKDLASKLKLIDTNQHLVEARSRLDTNLGEQQKLIEQIAGAEADRDAYTGEWKRKLAEDMAQTRSDRDGAAARLSKARMRHSLAVLKAPRDAIVLEVAARPPGSVVREAEPLMRLVPTDAPLVAEVQVDTRDVARLRLDDPVTIKYEALPWQQFGLAHGRLLSLTPDTVEDRSERETAEDMASPGLKTQQRQSPIHYRARIELSDVNLHNLPPGFVMRSGMRLVADIKVGRRSVLEYVLNPITRVFSESLHEP